MDPIDINDQPIEGYEKNDNIVIITKNTKIIYKIFSKMNIIIKSTYKIFDESNISIIMTQTMRQLNKENIYGFEKKEIAICIMLLLLDSLSAPDIITKFNADSLCDLIELIYNHNMHRYKTEKTCLII